MIMPQGRMIITIIMLTIMATTTMITSIGLTTISGRPPEWWMPEAGLPASICLA